VSLPTPEPLHAGPSPRADAPVLGVLLGTPDDAGGGALDPAQFETWCRSHAGSRATLWLAASLTLPLLADAGARFADEAALHAYARRVLGAYEHDVQGAITSWRSGAGWLGLRRATAAAGACLLHAEIDPAALHATAARHGVQLLGMHPLWAGALAQARQQHALLQRDAVLLVAEGRQVTALRLQGGALVALRSHWLASATAAELEPLRAEWAALGLPVFASGHGLSGAAPALLRTTGPLDQDAQALATRLLGALQLRHGLRAGAARPLAPDFLPAAARGPRSAMGSAPGWALASTGALVLALAALDAGQAWQSWQAARQAAAQASLPVHAANERRATARAVAPSGAAANPSAQQQALARLAHPWPQLFESVEAATPSGGQWLRLEHRSSDALLRVAGTAPSMAEALRVASRIDAAPALAEAVLWRSDVAAGGAISFELSARVAGLGAGAAMAGGVPLR
jgi:hypothetical protein